MRIIKTDKHEREGNDCMIYNTLTLYEHDGEYFFQVDEKVTGWCEDESSRTYEFGRIECARDSRIMQEQINIILDDKFYGRIKFDICDTI